MKTLLKLISIIILTCSITYAPKGTYATVTDTTQRVQYTATADQTLFAYTWRILDQDDMDVYVNGVISTAYSVSNVGEASGGNITFNSGRTSGDIIVIIRNIPETQETSYPAGGRLSTVNLEKNLDKLTLLVQDLEEEVGRATKMPATSTQSNVDFPEGSSATDRATKVPAWNSAGTGLELIASTNVDATSVIATQGDLVIGSSSGAAAKLAIGNAGEILTASGGSVVWIQSRKAAWKKGTDIVGTTTTTIDIPDEDANYYDVTGTSTIVAIESVGTGSLVRFHFDELGTLTHHDIDLVLPGSSTIRYLKGDEFTFYEYQSGDYRLVASGQKLDPKITSVSAAYTAVTADEVILGSSTVGADFTITLYPLAGIANSELTVSNIGTNTITVDGNASELIDGATTFTLNNQYDAKTIITDGVEWFTKSDSIVIGVVQVVGSSTGAVATTTIVTVDDDSIPQNDEGQQFMFMNFTPKASTNNLIIEVTVVLSHSVTAVVGQVALFQDNTANAIAAVSSAFTNSSLAETISFSHFMTAGTTSQIVFRVRAGSSNAGTTTFNGQGGGRKLGGVMASSILVTEIVP